MADLNTWRDTAVKEAEAAFYGSNIDLQRESLHSRSAMHDYAIDHANIIAAAVEHVVLPRGLNEEKEDAFRDLLFDSVFATEYHKQIADDCNVIYETEADRLSSMQADGKTLPNDPHPDSRIFTAVHDALSMIKPNMTRLAAFYTESDFDPFDQAMYYASWSAAAAQMHQAEVWMHAHRTRTFNLNALALRVLLDGGRTTLPAPTPVYGAYFEKWLENPVPFDPLYENIPEFRERNERAEKLFSFLPEYTDEPITHDQVQKLMLGIVKLFPTNEQVSPTVHYDSRVELAVSAPLTDAAVFVASNAAEFTVATLGLCVIGRMWMQRKSVGRAEALSLITVCGLLTKLCMAVISMFNPLMASQTTLVNEAPLALVRVLSEVFVKAMPVWSTALMQWATEMVLIMSSWTQNSYYISFVSFLSNYLKPENRGFYLTEAAGETNAIVDYFIKPQNYFDITEMLTDRAKNVSYDFLTALKEFSAGMFTGNSPLNQFPLLCGVVLKRTLIKEDIDRQIEQLIAKIQATSANEASELASYIHEWAGMFPGMRPFLDTNSVKINGLIYNLVATIKQTNKQDELLAVAKTNLQASLLPYNANVTTIFHWAIAFQGLRAAVSLFRRKPELIRLRRTPNVATLLEKLNSDIEKELSAVHYTLRQMRRGEDAFAVVVAKLGILPNLSVLHEDDAEVFRLIVLNMADSAANVSVKTFVIEYADAIRIRLLHAKNGPFTILQWNSALRGMYQGVEQLADLLLYLGQVDMTEVIGDSVLRQLGGHWAGVGVSHIIRALGTDFTMFDMAMMLLNAATPAYWPAVAGLWYVGGALKNARRGYFSREIGLNELLVLIASGPAIAPFLVVSGAANMLGAFTSAPVQTRLEHMQASVNALRTLLLDRTLSEALRTKLTLAVKYNRDQIDAIVDALAQEQDKFEANENVLLVSKSILITAKLERGKWDLSGELYDMMQPRLQPLHDKFILEWLGNSSASMVGLRVPSRMNTFCNELTAIIRTTMEMNMHIPKTRNIIDRALLGVRINKDKLVTEMNRTEDSNTQLKTFWKQVLVMVESEKNSDDYWKEVVASYQKWMLLPPLTQYTNVELFKNYSHDRPWIESLKNADSIVRKMSLSDALVASGALWRTKLQNNPHTKRFTLCYLPRFEAHDIIPATPQAAFSDLVYAHSAHVPRLPVEMDTYAVSGLCNLFTALLFTTSDIDEALRLEIKNEMSEWYQWVFKNFVKNLLYYKEEGGSLYTFCAIVRV